MSTDALGTYLNDHLAGSVSAVVMVERAIEEHAGTPFAAGLSELVAAIREDQAVLRSILARLGVSESTLKQAGGWLLEKAGRLKLGGAGDAALHRFEMLEALSLGIRGKLALWQALQRVAGRHPALAGFDLAALERRAREQHDRVETWRLDAAAEAL